MEIVRIPNDTAVVLFTFLKKIMGSFAKRTFILREGEEKKEYLRIEVYKKELKEENDIHFIVELTHNQNCKQDAKYLFCLKKKMACVDTRSEGRAKGFSSNPRSYCEGIITTINTAIREEEQRI